MKRTVIPECLPAEIRELIALDLARENRQDRNPDPRHRSQHTEASASNPDPASKETDVKDRESNGRFAKGNRGGSGNPFARQVAAFRACLISSVTQEDMQAIVYKLVDRARIGNLQAIKLLFSYLLGTPKPVVEPDELDLHEMNLAHQTALAAEVLKEATPARPAGDDAPPPPAGEVGRPAEGVPETPPPPTSTPSPNRTNRESCPPTASEAPSTNGESCPPTASEAPSTNRAKSVLAADVCQTRPSTNRANGKREPGGVCSGPPHGQSEDADEKQT
jgi:hypothetical protein